MPEDARVSVVVPARDAAATLPDALRSVLAQDPAVGEVVVGCAPDDDATRRVVAEVAATDARVRTVDVPGGRTPDALNAAIAATDGEVVVRCDAHAVLPPGYVATAVAALRDSGAGNVGGQQVPEADRGFARAVAAAMRSPFGAGGAAYRGRPTAGPVDTVYLGVFRRAALTAVGGYDARFTRNQDAELNVRLRAAGYEVRYEPGLAVRYQPRGTVRGLASQYLQYGRWRRLTARTHRGSLQPRQLAAPVLVLGLIAAIVLAVVTGVALLAVLPAAAYVAGLVVAGALSAPSPALIVPTAVALGTMHTSWGVGFLLGPPRGTADAAPRRVDDGAA
ncbi:glycosyltransferase family 2 protein [Nitriliruptoraceae bacterium ZYF776]|nr:glycosyltransferase family 2 protein [Profundirhabdus halotolerans]